MKQIKFLLTACAVSTLFLLNSCNSGEEKKTEATTKDTTAVQRTDTMPPVKPAKPNNLVVIRHKVANYAKWFPAYEGHDSVRRAYGIHNYILGRDLDDSNMVTVSLIMDDSAKAKEFAALPNLKETMKKGGVMGAPTMQYLDVQWLDTSAQLGPIRVRVTHKVKDWDAWKKAFDSHKQARMDAGLTDRMIAYNMDDHSMVTIVMAVSDLAKAKAFASSKDLKDKMAEGGVVGAPTIVWYTIAKKY
jgi:hypothetical protein